MGYYVDGGGQIILRKDTPQPILKRLEELSEDVFSDYCMRPCDDGAYEIEAYNHEKYHEDSHFEYLLTAEPYVIEGSLEFIGEDYSCWKDVYDKKRKKWLRIGGEIVYRRKDACVIFDQMKKTAEEYPNWYKQFFDNVLKTRTPEFISGSINTNDEDDVPSFPCGEKDPQTKAAEDAFGIEIPEGFIVDSCRIKNIKIGGND